MGVLVFVTLLVFFVPGFSNGDRNSEATDEHINDWIPEIIRKLVKRDAVEPDDDYSSGSGDGGGGGHGGGGNGGGNPKTAKPTKTPVTKPTKIPVTRPPKTPVTKPTKTPVTKPTKAPVTKPTKIPVTKPTEIPVTKLQKTTTTKPPKTVATKPPKSQATKFPTTTSTELPKPKSTQMPATAFTESAGNNSTTGTTSSMQRISNNCLQCILQIENGAPGCKMDHGSEACGPYQIHEKYWIDCGSPGASWKECAADMTCSETCVRNYERRYAQKCVGKTSVPTCEDYAGVHNGGPAGCRSTSTAAYRANITNCCSRKPGGC